MSRTSLFLPALAGPLAAALALVAAPTSARAYTEGPYSVEILVDGVPLAEYAARGTRYVEARDGREYSVRIGNHSADRIAVALSVDGLNTIDARRTSARAAMKWVVEPWGTVVISGWQTSGRDARRFYFTTEDRSYGARLGQTDDLGVIAAAVFRERRPRPWPGPITDSRGGARDQSAPARGRASSEAPASAQADAGENRGARAEAKAAPMAPPSDDYAATGMGRRVDHEVTRIDLELEATPAASFALRYEFRDALVRLGVLPRAYGHGHDPLARREGARGFSGFCPE